MSVKVKGTIVSNDDKWIYDWFGIDATCPNDIEKALAEEQGEEIIIEINSGGGDVFAGNEIYYLINKQTKKTKCVITGFAASAATIVCCGADTVEAVPGAQYMIHNVSCGASGDYNAMDHASEVLQNANKSISNIYRRKTGMSEAELLDLMNKETWMDVEKAKERGFIDKIIGDKAISLTNAIANVLSEDVKQKIRNTVKNPSSENTDLDFLIQQENLNLLKLKGEIKNEI